MPRVTVTTTPAVLCQNGMALPGDRPGNQADEYDRSFIVFPPFGTMVSVAVLLKPAKDGQTPDMNDAARFDFGKGMLNYVCEPGVALWAQAASGTVALDVLAGGER